MPAKNDKRSYVIILVLILFITVTLFIYLRFGSVFGLYESLKYKNSSNQDLVVPKTGDPLVQEKGWSDLMDRIGVAEAYLAFKNQYDNENFGVQHTVAHIIGELIYEKKGIEGLTICDSEFAFGCYHSFFGLALAENGTSVIQKLDAECVKKYGPLGTGCQHGIGHGLVEYFGHDYGGLTKSLDACKLTTQMAPLAGCTSGVFMEFNLSTILSDRGGISKTRDFDPGQPYYPCNLILAKYKDSCYYEMAQWLNSIPDFNDDFANIGRLCQGVESYENRISCYLGVGNVAGPSSNYEVEKAKEKCNSLPTKEGRIECLAGASWSFDANPDFRPLAYLLCEGLSSTDTVHCIRSSDVLKQKKNNQQDI